MASETALATHTESEDATSRPRYLSASDIRLVLELAANHTNQVDIAKAIGCSQGTISRTLKAFGTDAATVGQQLRAFTDESINDWRRAKKVAAKRGDHRPAKELIEMAYPELRPHQGNSAGGGGVTINIGMPGQPIALPDIDIRPLQPALSPSVSDDLHSVTGDS